MKDFIIANGKHIRGRMRGAYVTPQFAWPGRLNLITTEGLLPSGWEYATPWVPNLILYDWASIAAMALRNSPDGKQYHIGGMYLEFSNSGSAVTPPTFDRGDPYEYYDNLNNDNPDRDYLRVPLIASAGSNSDEENFTLDNVMTFFAQTAGSVGIHGLAFSDAAPSRVYGGALVCFRDPDNSSEDLIFSRAYYSDSSNQLTKRVGSQIGVTWEQELG